MKEADLAVLALAGVAVWMILRSGAGTSKTGPNTAPSLGAVVNTATLRTEEIFDTWGARFSNGWRYFSDGTAIDPQGRYWKDGQVIWSPAGTGGASGVW